MTSADPVGLYITQLRKSLAGFNVREREEIVEEIRAHILDRVAESGLTLEETLARLGPAEELAADYRSGALVRRARHSLSPWTILRASFRWALTGVQGLAVFLTVLVGYTTGAAFVLCGILKPLFPEQIGFWMGPDAFGFGFRADRPDAPELLGPWFTQVAIGLGLLFFIVTTLVVRRLLPKLRNSRISAAAATTRAAA